METTAQFFGRMQREIFPNRGYSELKSCLKIRDLCAANCVDWKFVRVSVFPTVEYTFEDGSKFYLTNYYRVDIFERNRGGELPLYKINY